MKRIKEILFVLMLVLVTSASVMAQDRSKQLNRLSGNIERGILQKEPGWRLAQRSSRENYLIHRWQSDGESVTASVFHLSSAEEAARKLNFSKGTIATRSPQKLDGLGDEAYLFMDDDKKDAAIHFRKANMHIVLNGSSREVAERFAKNLATAID